MVMLAAPGDGSRADCRHTFATGASRKASANSRRDSARTVSGIITAECPTHPEYFALQQAKFDVRQFEVESGGGNPTPPSTSWQQYRFCVSSVHVPKQTRDVWANRYEQARRILVDQLGNLGAGDGWNIGDGACK
jgi:hypothetical protein